eukprot:TRINITY_DN518_c0_g1_i11.p6 TRINITY_DN518_c0_g1~~TRINITY_DN518_c0_g1_i11.p6  ORF type:complete len:114 (+),score=20.19 TRINITY_DN518_c0_g1_i11:351-692(+)
MHSEVLGNLAFHFQLLFDRKAHADTALTAAELKEAETRNRLVLSWQACHLASAARKVCFKLAIGWQPKPSTSSKLPPLCSSHFLLPRTQMRDASSSGQPTSALRRLLSSMFTG